MKSTVWQLSITGDLLGVEFKSWTHETRAQARQHAQHLRALYGPNIHHLSLVQRWR